MGIRAKRLFILSNSKLKPALHIYEKNGFNEIKLDDYEYVRGDIAFEYILEECQIRVSNQSLWKSQQNKQLSERAYRTSLFPIRA